MIKNTTTPIKDKKKKKIQLNNNKVQSLVT